MKRLAVLIVATLEQVGAVMAAPKMVQQTGDWGVYSYDRNGRTTCYALSIPKDVKPADVDHGQNYFLIAPAEKDGRDEPEAIMGYDLKAGSMVQVSVGDQTFRMFTKENTAWVDDTAREPELIKAFRAGSRMTLEAMSARGTHTTYVYSLDGVTAALDRVARCK
ncbi:invasion associated locus B family protein [Rhizobium sp. YTU87027]|uniref:invasion associated locus B family protein n=1 Tax=Rhizobium sp. YTU87027 TaxID=3417741 RepID=UPI003D69F75E